MNILLRYLLLILTLSSTGPASASAQPPPLRILFVGNSYTYSHDLPRVVQRVAAARGIAVEVAALTAPGVAIEDHWANDDYQLWIAEGWDWVILQQGPSSLPANRRHLNYWVGRSADEARRYGVKTALFGVWPALSNAHTWANTELSYRKAALNAGGCVLPAAIAWRRGLAAEPGLPLYSEDLLHPAETGTLLTALVMVHGLFDGDQPQPISGLQAWFPESKWRAALLAAARLDRYALDAVQEEIADCEPRLRPKLAPQEAPPQRALRPGSATGRRPGQNRPT